MFCTECGEKFLEEDQKFCQKCGAITKTANAISQSDSQPKLMNIQSNSQIQQESSKSSQKLPTTGGIGIYSKRSLAFGITSLGCNLAGVIYYIIGNRWIRLALIMTIIIQVSFFVVALVFGILARSNGNEAEIIESSNGMQKAGRIMGLLGIIFSAIGMGNTVVFFVFGFDPIRYYIF
ncbi:MAG: hypothetical protein ACFFBP_02895 [Promethearchaeota archaeon]